MYVLVKCIEFLKKKITGILIDFVLNIYIDFKEGMCF